MKDVNIYIYTEYSGSMKSGTGKYHVMLETEINDSLGNLILWTNEDSRYPEQKQKPIMGCILNITRNKLELVALDEALNHMITPSRIHIYTSSDYIVGAFAQGWPEKWKRNNFQRKGKRIKHAELWKSIIEKIEKHEYSFNKSNRTTYTMIQTERVKEVYE